MGTTATPAEAGPAEDTTAERALAETIALFEDQMEVNMACRGEAPRHEMAAIRANYAMLLARVGALRDMQRKLAERGGRRGSGSPVPIEETAVRAKL